MDMTVEQLSAPAAISRQFLLDECNFVRSEILQLTSIANTIIGGYLAVFGGLETTGLSTHHGAVQDTVLFVMTPLLSICVAYLWRSLQMGIARNGAFLHDVSLKLPRAIPDLPFWEQFLSNNHGKARPTRVIEFSLTIMLAPPVFMQIGYALLAGKVLSWPSAWALGEAAGMFLVGRHLLRSLTRLYVRAGD